MWKWSYIFDYIAQNPRSVFLPAASSQSTIDNHMSPAHLMRKQNRLQYLRKCMKVYDIFVENITVSTGFLEYL